MDFFERLFSKRRKAEGQKQVHVFRFTFESAQPIPEGFNACRVVVLDQHSNRTFVSPPAQLQAGSEAADTQQPGQRRLSHSDGSATCVWPAGANSLAVKGKLKPTKGLTGWKTRQIQMQLQLQKASYVGTWMDVGGVIRVDLAGHAPPPVAQSSGHSTPSTMHANPLFTPVQLVYEMKQPNPNVVVNAHLTCMVGDQASQLASPSRSLAGNAGEPSQSQDDAFSLASSSTPSSPSTSMNGSATTTINYSNYHPSTSFSTASSSRTPAAATSQRHASHPGHAGPMQSASSRASSDMPRALASGAINPSISVPLPQRRSGRVAPVEMPGMAQLSNASRSGSLPSGAPEITSLQPGAGVPPLPATTSVPLPQGQHSGSNSLAGSAGAIVGRHSNHNSTGAAAADAERAMQQQGPVNMVPVSPSSSFTSMPPLEVATSEASTPHGGPGMSPMHPGSPFTYGRRSAAQYSQGGPPSASRTPDSPTASWSSRAPSMPPLEVASVTSESVVSTSQNSPLGAFGIHAPSTAQVAPMSPTVSRPAGMLAPQAAAAAMPVGPILHDVTGQGASSGTMGTVTSLPTALPGAATETAGGVMLPVLRKDAAAARNLGVGTTLPDARAESLAVPPEPGVTTVTAEDVNVVSTARTVSSAAGEDLVADWDTVPRSASATQGHANELSSSPVMTNDPMVVDGMDVRGVGVDVSNPPEKLEIAVMAEGPAAEALQYQLLTRRDSSGDIVPEPSTASGTAGNGSMHLASAAMPAAAAGVLGAGGGVGVVSRGGEGEAGLAAVQHSAGGNAMLDSRDSGSGSAAAGIFVSGGTERDLMFNTPGKPLVGTLDTPPALSHTGGAAAPATAALAAPAARSTGAAGTPAGLRPSSLVTTMLPPDFAPTAVTHTAARAANGMGVGAAPQRPALPALMPGASPHMAPQGFDLDVSGPLARLRAANAETATLFPIESPGASGRLATLGGGGGGGGMESLVLWMGEGQGQAPGELSMAALGPAVGANGFGGGAGGGGGELSMAALTDLAAAYEDNPGSRAEGRGMGGGTMASALMMVPEVAGEESSQSLSAHARRQSQSEQRLMTSDDIDFAAAAAGSRDVSAAALPVSHGALEPDVAWMSPDRSHSMSAAGGGNDVTLTEPVHSYSARVPGSLARSSMAADGTSSSAVPSPAQPLGINTRARRSSTTSSGGAVEQAVQALRSGSGERRKSYSSHMVQEMNLQEGMVPFVRHWVNADETPATGTDATTTAAAGDVTVSDAAPAPGVGIATAPVDAAPGADVASITAAAPADSSVQGGAGAFAGLGQQLLPSTTATAPASATAREAVANQAGVMDVEGAPHGQAMHHMEGPMEPLKEEEEAEVLRDMSPAGAHPALAGRAAGDMVLHVTVRDPTGNVAAEAADGEATAAQLQQAQHALDAMLATATATAATAAQETQRADRIIAALDQPDGGTLAEADCGIDSMLHTAGSTAAAAAQELQHAERVAAAIDQPDAAVIVQAQRGIDGMLQTAGSSAATAGQEAQRADRIAAASAQPDAAKLAEADRGVDSLLQTAGSTAATAEQEAQRADRIAAVLDKPNAAKLAEADRGLSSMLQTADSTAATAEQEAQRADRIASALDQPQLVQAAHGMDSMLDSTVSTAAAPAHEAPHADHVAAAPHQPYVAMILQVERAMNSMLQTADSTAVTAAQEAQRADRIAAALNQPDTAGAPHAERGLGSMLQNTNSIAATADDEVRYANRDAAVVKQPDTGMVMQAERGIDNMLQTAGSTAATAEQEAERADRIAAALDEPAEAKVVEAEEKVDSMLQTASSTAATAAEEVQRADRIMAALDQPSAAAGDPVDSVRPVGGAYDGQLARGLPMSVPPPMQPAAATAALKQPETASHTVAASGAVTPDDELTMLKAQPDTLLHSHARLPEALAPIPATPSGLEPQFKQTGAKPLALEAFAASSVAPLAPMTPSAPKPPTMPPSPGLLGPVHAAPQPPPAAQPRAVAELVGLLLLSDAQQQQLPDLHQMNTNLQEVLPVLEATPHLTPLSLNSYNAGAQQVPVHGLEAGRPAAVDRCMPSSFSPATTAAAMPEAAGPIVGALQPAAVGARGDAALVGLMAPNEETSSAGYPFDPLNTKALPTTGATAPATGMLAWGPFGLADSWVREFTSDLDAGVHHMLAVVYQHSQQQQKQRLSRSRAASESGAVVQGGPEHAAVGEGAAAPAVKQRLLLIALLQRALQLPTRQAALGLGAVLAAMSAALVHTLILIMVSPFSRTKRQV